MGVPSLEDILKVIAVALMGLFVAGLMGWAIGSSFTDETWRKEAVEKGHAYYQAVDGKPVWTWKGEK